MHLVVFLLAGLSFACHVGARRIQLGTAERPKGSWESSRVQQTDQPFFARNEARPQSRANLVEELRSQGILSRKGSEKEESSGMGRGRRTELQPSEGFGRGPRRDEQQRQSSGKARGRRNEPQAESFVRSPRKDEPAPAPRPPGGPAPAPRPPGGSDENLSFDEFCAQRSKQTNIIDELKAQYREKHNMDGPEAQVDVEKPEASPDMQAPQTGESSQGTYVSQSEPQPYEGRSIDESQARARANMMEELKATLRTGSSEAASNPLNERKPHEAYSAADSYFETDSPQTPPTGSVIEEAEQPEMSLQVHGTHPREPGFWWRLIDSLSTLIQASADFVDELEALVEDQEHEENRKLKEHRSKTQLQAQSEADSADELEAQVEGKKGKKGKKDKKDKNSKRKKALRTTTSTTSETADAPPTEPEVHDAPSRAQLHDQEWADLVEELEGHMMGKKREKSKRKKKIKTKKSSETADVPPTEPGVHDDPSKTQLQAQSEADSADELEAPVEGKKHKKSSRRKTLQTKGSSETADLPPTEPQEHDVFPQSQVQAQPEADFADELEARVEGKKHRRSTRRKTLHTTESSETAYLPPTEPQVYNAVPQIELQAQSEAQSEAEFADELEAQESSNTADVPPAEPTSHDTPSKTQLQTQSGEDPIQLETQTEGEQHKVSQQMKASQTEEASETARVPEIKIHSHDLFLKDEQTQSEPVARAEVDNRKASLETKAPLRLSVKTRVPKIEIQSYDDVLWKAKVRAQSGADFANDLEAQAEGSLETKPDIDPHLHDTLGGVFGADFVDELAAHLGGEHREMNPPINRPQTREPIKPELRDALGDVFGEDFVDELETQPEE